LWVAISLASFILVIILILCVPLNLVFHIDTRARPRTKLSIVWFFGLVDKNIRKKTPEKKDKVKPAKESKGRIDRQLVSNIVRIKGLYEQIKQFIRDLFSCFNLRELFVDLIVHPDDPADTGILYALALPLNNLMGSSPSYRINIWPSFDSDTTFEGTIAGSMKLHPVKLFKPLTRFVFSMPAARLIYTFVSNKWKKEN
jgi:hypothetical protein